MTKTEMNSSKQQAETESGADRRRSKRDRPQKSKKKQSKMRASKKNRRRLLRHAARRRLWDRAARVVVSIGGLGIIASLLLIFFYLVYEVLPLFQGVDFSGEEPIPRAVSGQPAWLEVDSAAGVALRIDGAGVASFLDLDTGALLGRETLPRPAGARLATVAGDAAGSGLFAVGFDDGGVLIAGWSAPVEAGETLDSSRPAPPGLRYPLGQTVHPVLEGEPVRALALRSVAGGVEIAAAGPGGAVALLTVPTTGDSPGLAPPVSRPDVAGPRLELNPGTSPVERILLPRDPRWMLLVSADDERSDYELRLVSLEDGENAGVVDTAALTSPPVRLTHARLLAGGESLLAADDAGKVGQWFIVREAGGPRLRRVREFDLFDTAVGALEVERGRRVFAAVGGSADGGGEIALVDVTAGNVHTRRGSGIAAFPAAPFAASFATSFETLGAAALAPAGDLLLLEDGSGRLASWRIDHPFAEFSLAALWRPTWYENYPEPALVWQSSAADDTFEPKYSLAPLTFGTLKAAFYAMLFAAPLAVCAAVFTGYFMPPGARRQIKPLIELMEALPTVVIGFLAGLWLAPLVDANLAALALGALLLPLAVLLASLILARLPERFGFEFAEGWQLPALAPVLLLAGWLAWWLSPGLENALFDGSLKDWLTRRWGLDYVSRNALIVGAAMGFAVIPAIYSIADDAIFTVPRHLSYGALAMGANRWQTLTWLILPAAAPGILSALLIGFGRAIGETMIVLMATGNTPIMDMNLFEGMRSLAAGLAIEIPESEVGSTHYRILFLAALVLLLFTFAINSAAELLRLRLRRKYRMI